MVGERGAYIELLVTFRSRDILLEFFGRYRLASESGVVAHLLVVI